MDDFFDPPRDELADWKASVQREWENWERLEQRGDIWADYTPPPEEDDE